MLSQEQELILSEYSGLYDIVVPQDNLLRRINSLIDFSFVYQELVDKYCSDNGRMAESPIRMFKYLLLKASTTSPTWTLWIVPATTCRLNTFSAWLLRRMSSIRVLCASSVSFA